METIHSARDDGRRVCVGCKQELPADTDHFYIRKRSNGNSYFTSRCKPCVRQQTHDARAADPERHRDIQARSLEKNRETFNANRRLKIAEDANYRAKRNQQTREWIERNKDRTTLYRVAYYSENKDRIKASVRDYYERTPDKQRTWRRNRRARVAGAEGEFTASDIAKRLSEQHCKCFWCKDSITDGYHADHYIPLARSGTNHPYNIVLACGTCNTSRRDKMPVEFFEYLRLIRGMADEIEIRRAYFRQKTREHRARKRDEVRS